MFLLPSSAPLTFEKPKPNDLEQESALGKPYNPAQSAQFETHKKFVIDYHTRRKTVAASKTSDLGSRERAHF